MQAFQNGSNFQQDFPITINSHLADSLLLLTPHYYGPGAEVLAPVVQN